MAGPRLLVAQGASQAALSSRRLTGLIHGDFSEFVTGPAAVPYDEVVRGQPQRFRAVDAAF